MSNSALPKKPNPVWGWLGEPPAAVRSAGWGFGKRWNALSVEYKEVMDRPTSRTRTKLLQQIDWKKESLVYEAVEEAAKKNNRRTTR